MKHEHPSIKHAIKAILSGVMPPQTLEVMEALALLAYVRLRGVYGYLKAGGAHGTQPR